MIREGDSLLRSYPTAPNRYQVLGILFRGRREFLSLDKSAGNREALIETSRQLAGAPDVYAAIRLDADLLLSQTELARQGADLEARGSVAARVRSEAGLFVALLLDQELLEVRAPTLRPS